MAFTLSPGSDGHKEAARGGGGAAAPRRSGHWDIRPDPYGHDAMNACL